MTLNQKRWNGKERRKNSDEPGNGMEECLSRGGMFISNLEEEHLLISPDLPVQRIRAL
jgi:hypothetical protein